MWRLTFPRLVIAVETQLLLLVIMYVFHVHRYTCLVDRDGYNCLAIVAEALHVNLSIEHVYVCVSVSVRIYK
jgi:hypothetical protein